MENERIDRVLVIDDDDATRQVLARSLTRMGYAVETAADGEEGLAAALASVPQVIISDIRMPRMDGHTLLRRLRSQGLETAVVMISGQGGMDDVVDALRNGAVDYLKKPWLPGDLAAATARAVEITEMRRSLRLAQSGTASGPPTELASSPASAASGPAPTPEGDAPKTAKESTAAIFSALLEQVRRGELTLPAVPFVLQELRALIARREATLEQVVVLIARDQRLVAQVIRLANSVQYAGLTRVTGIQAAVTRVGFRNLEDIAEAAFAQSCYRPVHARFAALQSRIWKHAVARAVSMRALAELAGAAAGADPATAYLAGLMSDAGAAFLLWMIAERERDRPPGREADAMVDCLTLIRNHHQEIGGLLTRAWDLSPVIAFAAAGHHAETAPSPPNPYWALSVLASSLAGDDVTFARTPGAALLERCRAELHIGLTPFTAAQGKLGREIDAILESLSENPRTG